jgi:hypothetical protein
MVTKVSVKRAEVAMCQLRDMLRFMLRDWDDVGQDTREKFVFHARRRLWNVEDLLLPIGIPSHHRRFVA